MPRIYWQRTPNFSVYLIVLLNALLNALLPACSWTFDESTPDVPLLGEAIPPTLFPKLNVEPARDAFIVTDLEGLPWVAMPAAAPLNLTVPLPPSRDTIKLLRLDAAAPSDGRERKELTAHHSVISTRAIYLFEPPGGTAKEDPQATTHVTVFFPALTPVAQMFSMPRGDEVFATSATDAAFLYFVPQGADKQLRIITTDGAYQRVLPPPAGYETAEGRAKLYFAFDRSGDRLFVRAANGHFFVHATREEKSLDLGVVPGAFVFDGQQRYLITCSDAGLMRMALDGNGTAVLDKAACNPDILRLSGSSIYAKSGDALHSVPADGSAPPQVALAGPIGQLFFISTQWGPIYSLDSPITYGAGIGDGWLGDWQFMLRGRRPGFSRDGLRLRWLENAARSDNSGDLTSATVADRTVLQVARNVRTTSELADGRVLAISNAAFKGTQNRLIVIDEKARSARWVVDNARDFLIIPGTNDVLAKIIVGQLGYDIRRVPIPQ